jgi:hypothetical protein
MATLAPRLDRFTAATRFEQEMPRLRILEEEDRYAIPRFPNDDVYLYIKHINNSRVARETEPGARQMCWRVIGSGFAVAIVVIGLLLPALYGLMAGYRLEALRQDRQRLELDRASLELQETKLLSPARLEELARRQRFIDPALDHVVYLDEKLSDQILAKK